MYHLLHCTVARCPARAATRTKANASERARSPVTIYGFSLISHRAMKGVTRRRGIHVPSLGTSRNSRRRARTFCNDAEVFTRLGHHSLGLPCHQRRRRSLWKVVGRDDDNCARPRGSLVTQRIESLSYVIPQSEFMELQIGGGVSVSRRKCVNPQIVRPSL